MAVDWDGKVLGHISAFDFNDSPSPDTPLTLLRWCRETSSAGHFAGLCKAVVFFMELNCGSDGGLSLTDPLSEDDDGGQPDDASPDPDTSMLQRVLRLVEFALLQSDPRANMGAAMLLDTLCSLAEALSDGENDDVAAGLVMFVVNKTVLFLPAFSLPLPVGFYGVFSHPRC